MLRIGKPSAALDALLDHFGETTGACVSAANPRGRRASASTNARAHAAPLRALRLGRRAHIAGEGRDRAGAWAPEASVLVLGLPRSGARRLGRRLRQNAIVYVERGKAPELLILV
ncbi:MAG: DUF3293 domain-containing protein [Burkholderiales bacterium]